MDVDMNDPPTDILTPSARLNSLVVSAFPWTRPEIADAKNLSDIVATDNLSMNFAKKLDQFDAQVYKSTFDYDVQLQSLLYLPTTENEDLRIEAQKNARTGLFNYLLRLRIVDRIFPPAAVAPTPVEDQMAIKMPRHVRATAMKSSCRPFVLKSKNWVTLVQKAKKALDIRITVPAVDPNRDPLQPRAPAGLKIIQSIGSNNGFTDLKNILFNLDTAALYLVKILVKSPTSVPAKEPENAHFVDSAIRFSDELAQSVHNDGTVSVHTATHFQLTEEEREQARRALGVLTVSQAKYPLQAALMISPVLLLDYAKVGHWKFNVTDMLQSAKDFGNCAPLELVQVENLIFSGLADMARGLKSSMEVLEDVIQGVSHMPLDTLEQEVTGWLSAEYRSAVSEVDLLQLNLESPIPPSMPWVTDLLDLVEGYSVQGVFIPSQPNAVGTSRETQPPASQPVDNGGGGVENENALPKDHGNDEPHREEGGGDKGSEGPTDQRATPPVVSPPHSPAPPSPTPPKTKRPKDKLPSSEPSSPPPKPSNKQTGTKRSGGNRSRSVITLRDKSVPIDSLGPGVSLVSHRRLWRPINYALLNSPMPDHTLVVSDKPTKFFTRDDDDNVLHVYGSGNKVVKVNPRAHVEADIAKLVELLSSAEEFYVDKLPMHLMQHHSLSAISLTTKSNFTFDPAVFIKSFRKQHIHVCHQKTKNAFNIEALLAIYSYSCTLKITDHSIPLDDTDRVKDGTIVDLDVCATDPKCKILSAAKIPIAGAGWNVSSYSTDFAAWKATVGMKYAKHDIPIPIGDFTFASAGTAGAMFWWQLAPNGLCMNLRIKSGGMVLVIGRPPMPLLGEHKEQLSYDSYDEFATAEFLQDVDMASPSPAEWISETVYLDSSSSFIMRPCTPYAIYVASNCIWETNYFYCGGTMRNTLVGLILHLLYGTHFSTEQCTPHMMMLHRMIQLYYRAFVDCEIESPDPALDHLPDLTDNDSLTDFFSLCIIGIMSNVLDIRTYQEAPEFDGVEGFTDEFDMNAMPWEDRSRCVHIRALSYNLLDWFFATHEISEGTKGPIQGARRVVFEEPFADILHVISTHAEKQQVYRAGMHGNLIKAQINSLVANEQEIAKLMAASPNDSGLSWMFSTTYSVTVKQGVVFNNVFSDYEDRAHTYFDDLFFGRNNVPEDEEAADEEVSEGGDHTSDDDYNDAPKRAKKRARKETSTPPASSSGAPRKKQKTAQGNASGSGKQKGKQKQ